MGRKTWGKIAGIGIGVLHDLIFKRRKELIESALISNLRYEDELVSGGSSDLVWKMSRLQTKAARIIQKVGKRNWSRTEGLQIHGMAQLPATSTIKQNNAKNSAH